MDLWELVGGLLGRVILPLCLIGGLPTAMLFGLAWWYSDYPEEQARKLRALVGKIESFVEERRWEWEQEQIARKAGKLPSNPSVQQPLPPTKYRRR